MMMALSGLILAGGRSLRMGRDKGALSFHGQVQTRHIAALLKPYVKEVFVSVRREQVQSVHLQGMRLIHDYYASPSPLNGIVSAMREVPGGSWLVVAVDMPHVSADAIETLIEKRDPAAIATCFESPVKGGPDPLLAIWEGHGFETLEKMLGTVAEHVCPRAALKSLPSHILRNAVPAQVLENINTPEELKMLQARAS